MIKYKCVFQTIVLLTICCGLFGFTRGHLFDTRTPLIFQDPLLTSSGRPTYFGYSVLLFNRNNYTWVQIGAPRSNCSFLPKVVEPGRVYRCEITKPCRVLLVDKMGTYESNERRDGSWLGGSMAIHSTADKMVICAPRWINKRTRRDWLMEGACYIGNPTQTDVLSTFFDQFIPPVGNEVYSQPNWNGHFVYDYAMGEAGISAYFTKENSHTEKKRSKSIKMVLGAPGILNWRGSTVLLETQEMPSIVNKKRSFFGSNSEGIVPFLLTTPGLRDGDYIGYSSTSGYFFSKDELIHVAGAPRGSQYFGKVFLYEFPGETRQKSNIRQSLSGDTFGGYFGAAVAAADFSGDGLDDLVVGAPYSPIPKVHIFLGNQKGKVKVPTNGAQTIKILQWGRDSLFGIALATDDLNQDRFYDVIVGAPGVQGRGAIAIFLGCADGVKSTPDQKILAEDIAPGLGLRGFGISISPPVDIDNNAYTDVAIGAHFSGHSVILRSRPRANLIVRLITKEKLMRDSNSTKVELCLLYHWKHKASNVIKVSRVMTIDSAFGRATLRGSKGPAVYNHTKSLEAMRESCEILDIVLQKNNQNFLDPIEITVNATILEKYIEPQVVLIDNEAVKGIDLFDKLAPIIDSDGTARLSVPFSTGCGDDNICISDLRVNAFFPNHSDSSFVLGSSGSILLEIVVENLGEPAYLAQAQVDIPSPAALSRLPPSCRTDSLLICNIENPLKTNSTKKLQLEIDMQGVSHTAKSGTTLAISVEAITKSEAAEPKRNFFKAELPLTIEATVAVAGKSMQDTYSYFGSDNQNPVELVFFKHLYEVQKFGASPVEEVLLVVKLPYKYIHNREEINFIQIYQPDGYQSGQPFSCQNNDFSYAVNNPTTNDFNENLLIDSDSIKEPPQTIKKAKRSLQNEYFNPMFVPETFHNMEFDFNRVRRVKREDKPEVTLPANRTVMLECEDPNMICHEVKCRVGPFRRPQNVARLMITMALNVSLLKEKVMGLKDIVVILSSGAAVMESGEGTGGSAEVRSVFINSPPEAQVAIWIIALSVILGMLLLLLMTMGLVKAGFFKRTKKDELEALKHATEPDNPESEIILEEEDLKDDFTLEH